MAITKFSTSNLHNYLNKTNLIDGLQTDLPPEPPTGEFDFIGSTFIWSTNDKTIALPVGTQVGDFVLQLSTKDGGFDSDAGSDAGFPVFPVANGFTSLYRDTVGDTSCLIAYRFVNTAMSSISGSGFDSDEIHAFYVFRGINVTTPIVTPIITPIFTRTTDQQDPPALIVQNSNSVVLVPMFFDDYLAAPVAPSGYTLLTTYNSGMAGGTAPGAGLTAPAYFNNANSVGLMYKEVTAAGSENPGLITGGLGDDGIVTTMELRLA